MARALLRSSAIAVSNSIFDSLSRTCILRTIPIALDSFDEQLFGPCSILFLRAAPSEGDAAKQHGCNADPRIDGSRVVLERALEIPKSLLQAGCGNWPVIPSPSAHDEIARVGIDRLRQLDPAS